ncbi:MAG: hypothetical protein WBE80_13000 [Methylocella sp.]
MNAVIIPRQLHHAKGHDQYKDHRAEVKGDISGKAMKLVHLAAPVALVGSLVLPAHVEAQQWKCENGPQAFDKLAHEATLGSTVLALSEETAVGVAKKKGAAMLALAGATYEVVKDACQGSETYFCKVIFCTQENSSGPGNRLGFVGVGPAFQNATGVEKRLTRSKIGDLSLHDRDSLSQDLKSLFPEHKWYSQQIPIDDFRPSGN